MNIVIADLGSYIEVDYNDLAPIIGDIKGLYRKDSVIEITIKDNSNFVSIYTQNDRKYDISFDMVSTPVVTSNYELYEAIKLMLV